MALEQREADFLDIDDQTMTNITVNSLTLAFNPANTDSYFYETFPCQAAQTNGFNAISFNLQGPANGSFTVEMQSVDNCATAAALYTSSFQEVSGLTGQTQLVTVPFSGFHAANPDGITAFVWATFSSISAWKLGSIRFVCTDPSIPGEPIPTPTSIPTPVPTSAISTIISTTTVTATSIPSPTPKRANVDIDAIRASPNHSTVSSSECSTLLIDDWESQSRLTFLGYNALLQASSDDGSMKSIEVKNNSVTLTPMAGSSYLYTQLGCMNVEGYGGISLQIQAAQGASFTVKLSSQTQANCMADSDDQVGTFTTKQLGWTFDGTMGLFSIPFDHVNGFDTTRLNTVTFTSLKSAIKLGPMVLYCGEDPVRYVDPSPTVIPYPTATDAAPVGTASAMVIDTFKNKDINYLKQYHGADDGVTLNFSNQGLRISTNDSDLAFYTQFGKTCTNMEPYNGSYLHIQYSGSNKFSVALQQHNLQCNASVQPYPETWDSLEAARYSTSNGHIYVPMSHFNINMSRAIGVSLEGFYTLTPTTLTKIEIVPSIPSGVTIPEKLPSGNLVFACKRPNSFAFAIDDGEPELAQQVMDIVKEEKITVTFFTVGLPLEDPTTNLSRLYNEMQGLGHQIALHSYTHPKMEGLPDYAAIDWEYNNDIAAVQKVLNGMHTPYFRPPFGTTGARMRQRLATALGTPDPYVVRWSVDVEDWLWAETQTPEKQLDAFKRDVAAGGNLVVMHYLYPSTVGYLKEFIQLAKATGKQLMRVDQCMMDPNAPPLPGE